MTTRGEINSNFYQIVEVDANGAPTLVKPEYIGPVTAVDANIANVHISGGTDGYVLQTDGTGNLTWTAQSGGGGNGVPGGANTQVQFNDAGVFGGEADFTYDKTTQTLTANNFSATDANLGQLYVEGNIQSNSSVYVGYTANLTGLTNPTIIAKASGATFVQAAVVNGSPEGSADYVTYGDNGSDSGAWADMGFTGSNFSDPLYTITGINDGYFFVQGDDSSAYGGNLVIATGAQGFQKDIIFATGGFLAEDEKMRYIHSAGQLYIQPNTVSSNTTTGALRVAGGVGVGGDINAGNSISAGYFVGDGGFLSNLTIAGNIANANYANYAGNAFAVDGINVVGYVNNAIHANVADSANTVAGSNVTGTVALAVHANVADVANSIAASNISGVVANANYAAYSGIVLTNAQPYITSLGLLTNLTVTGNLSALNIAGNGAAISSITGANVTGVVANATNATNAANAIQANVANVANSVSVANVTGIGNIATLNLNGSSTEVLYGNGVFANIGANISANFAAYAGNVTVNAQPNITSVGNLLNLQLNTSVTPFTANVGQMFWDTSEETITLGMNNGVQQQIGLETYTVVKASSAITDGQVVMFTGASGLNLTAAPADASSAGFRPGYILGIATQNIALNQTGYITAFGQVHGLNTVAWNVGDMLWYDPTSTTGAVTNVQPVDPNFQIQVGFVTRKNAVDGHIQVRIDSLNSLMNLTDVGITAPVVGQSLIYAGANIWVNGDVENANIANTVSVNAQPNITSLGTLANLTIAGNLTVTSNGVVTLGNVGNVKINGGTSGAFLTSTGGANMTWTTPSTANITIGNLTIANTLTISTQTKLKLGGGTTGQFLQTDGASNLTWASVTGASVAGNTSEIQFNKSGVFGASNTFRFVSDIANLIQPNLIIGSNVTGQDSIITMITNSTTAGEKTSTIIKPHGLVPAALKVLDDTGLWYDGLTTGSFAIYNSPSVDIGSVSNLHISGGTTGQFLQTDGAGALAWASVSGAPGGNTTEVQFNNGGVFEGVADFYYDVGTTILHVPAVQGSLIGQADLATTAYGVNASVITDVVIQGGTSGQVISTDGAGNLSWVDQSGGGGGTTDVITPLFLLGGM